MKRLIFAIFDDFPSAQAALTEVEMTPGARDDIINIVLHRDGVANSDLISGETGGRRGVFIGAVLGLIGGAVLGALLGAVGVAATGVLMTALLVGVGGALFGAVGGAIVGQSEPDPRILPMVEDLHRGQTLMTIETWGSSEELELDQILVRHGARIREKVMMTQQTIERPAPGPVRLHRDA